MAKGKGNESSNNKNGSGGSKSSKPTGGGSNHHDKTKMSKDDYDRIKKAIEKNPDCDSAKSGFIDRAKKALDNRK